MTPIFRSTIPSRQLGNPRFTRIRVVAGAPVLPQAGAAALAPTCSRPSTSAASASPLSSLASCSSSSTVLPSSIASPLLSTGADFLSWLRVKAEIGDTEP
ncbi:hypothetical protein BRADI_1g32283v3 [Brachypodium distachyon]|uniref:Uncharacterized protein n=1 Tax=Brachypodium distachyon TaxID=15368 RepID=A0A0Q3H2C2_BRADI|nr:hypothetical protein BRADI_1g32283v3 [Brachypodium distachyon]